jgi:hypothetical protein
MGIIFGKIDVAEPAYKVLLSRATPSIPYEIRKYNVRYACETTYSGSENEGSQSISMTAPVVTEEGQSIAMTAPVVTTNVGTRSTNTSLKKMQFFLPEEYNTMKSIPKPTNPNVTIQKIPAATGVVHTFTGTAGDAKTKKKVKALVEQLKDDGLELDEDQVLQKYSLWQYNPPFTIPIMRRNEVWIDLTDDEVARLIGKFQN